MTLRHIPQHYILISCVVLMLLEVEQYLHHYIVCGANVTGGGATSTSLYRVWC